MKKEFRTIRVWKKTWRKLRLLAALTNQTMVKVLDNLVNQGLSYVSSQETHNTTITKQQAEK